MFRIINFTIFITVLLVLSGCVINSQEKLNANPALASINIEKIHFTNLREYRGRRSTSVESHRSLNSPCATKLNSNDTSIYCISLVKQGNGTLLSVWKYDSKRNIEQAGSKFINQQWNREELRELARIMVARNGRTLL